MFVYCIKTAEDIVKHLSRSDSAIILLFDPKRRYPPISTGIPSAGRPSTPHLVWAKVATFDWCCRLPRKQYEIVPRLLWNVYEVMSGGRSVRSDDLEWPWKAGHDGSYFRRIPNNARTVWPRTMKFGRITHLGSSVVSHALTARWQCPSANHF